MLQIQRNGCSPPINKTRHGWSCLGQCDLDRAGVAILKQHDCDGARLLAYGKAVRDRGALCWQSSRIPQSSGALLLSIPKLQAKPAKNVITDRFRVPNP